MLRNAISAFTRVFDAPWLAAWCAADPGSVLRQEWVPALRRIVKNAAQRPGRETFQPSRSRRIALSAIYSMTARRIAR
jgi:hypothetical protein